MTRKARPPTGDGGTRLEHEMSLERVIEASGLSLTRNGSKITFGCPFHSSDGAHATISSKSNTWSCTTCKVTDAGVVAWMMKSKGVSKKHAIELLRSDEFIRSESGAQAKSPKALKRISRQTLPTPFATDASDTGLLASVADYYHDALQRHADPTTLLTDLGLTSSELITEHRIGICERTLAYRLPPSNRKGGAVIREQLTRIGVMRDSGQEALRGCVTVPLFDPNGVIVGLYGRRLLYNATKHASRDVFTGACTTTLWNSKVFGASPDIVVFESIFDALTTWCIGTRNVTALHAGADQVELLIELVKASGTKKITLVRSADSTSVAEPVSKACPSTEVYEAVVHSKTVGRGLAGLPGGVSGVLARATWIGGKPRKAGPLPMITAPVVEIPIVVPVTIDAVTSAPSAISPATIAPSAISPTTIAPGATAPVVEPVTPSPPKAADPVPDPPDTRPDQDILIECGDRRWRVRGLDKNPTYNTMRVNLRVAVEHRDPRLCGYHVDTLELLSARQRSAFVTAAAEELHVDADVIKRDLGAVLLRLEELQDKLIRAASESKEVRPSMSEPDRAAALELLKDPHLLDRVADDLDRTGGVGERSNRLIGYLVATSRLLDQPLALLIQSSSSAGKSSLMDSILGVIPDEDTVSFSSITGQSLFYIEPGALVHKLLSIAEEEGSSRASYALKLLQSEGSLTIGSTAREPATGRMTTCTYRVDGPVALITSTTSTTVDEELANRCIVLAVDESRKLTEMIHTRQRELETLAGALARRDRDQVLHMHQNAQRLLRSVLVVNPFAHDLVFPTGAPRARRDHKKYLSLIRTIALLHQHQRPEMKVEHNGAVVTYIEVSKHDIAIANELSKKVFGSQSDDLPPHTRELLRRLEELVDNECTTRSIQRRDYRFSRREVRERLGIGGTQLWTHLRRLVEAEYLVVHPSRHGRGIVYELAGTGRAATTATRTGEDSGHVRGVVGADSGLIRGSESSTPQQDSQRDRGDGSGVGDLHDTGEGLPTGISRSHTASSLNGAGGA